MFSKELVSYRRYAQNDGNVGLLTHRASQIPVGKGNLAVAMLVWAVFRVIRRSTYGLWSTSGAARMKNQGNVFWLSCFNLLVAFPG